MHTSIGGLLTSFEGQSAGVVELLDFDALVLDHVVGGLTSIADDLEKQGRHTMATNVRHRLAVVRNIRTAGSLRPRYEVMFNQCVVLLVSYFGSTLGDLFKKGVVLALEANIPVPILDRVIEVSWRQIGKADDQAKQLFADAVVEQQKITFQDMQSTGRAFRDNLGVDVKRTDKTNDIIFGQAARHVIVHAGGIVDERMLAQVRSATPRTLKPLLARHKRIQFAPDEVIHLATSMKGYLVEVAELLDVALTSPTATSEK